MKQLNRARAFVEIFGVADYRFEQDGVKFDAQGLQIETDEDRAARAKAEAEAEAKRKEAEKARMLAVKGVLSLSVDKATAELADLSDDMLAAVKVAEASSEKPRTTLIEALDAEIAKRSGAGDQVSTQLS